MMGTRTKPPKIDVPISEKLLLSVREAGALLGLSDDTVYRLILDIDPETGRPALHSVRVGKLRKIPRVAINRWLEREHGA